METQLLDITRALAIDGWMSQQELTWLAKQAIEHRSIVEIGSYLGRSTRAMLDYCSHMLYAVDDWTGPRDVYLSREDRKSLYDKFVYNVQEYITTGRLKVISGDYEHLYKHSVHLKSLTPDMVFIDGSHDYDDVKRDITFWQDRLVQGGLLCGHDINFSDVQQAVEEVLGEYEVAEGTTIWYKLL